MSQPVGVVGASARAAVHSLARAGHSAWAVDLFADRDLARVAPCAVCPSDEYPAALPRLAKRFPTGPVLYTGGLENHPHVVAALAAVHELWGNSPKVLEHVRDPWKLAAATIGFAAPAIVPRDLPCPRTSRWLLKPLRSSAGHGIRFAEPNEAPSATHYFQEFIRGVPMSAVFVDHQLVGFTKQLIGEPWLHARPFTYCGSVGLLDMAPEVVNTLAHLGGHVAMVFGLSGVWNVDFILKDNVPYPVEVNPRYTASVEVLEHTTRQAILANGIRQPPKCSPQGSTIGKGVYYAPHAITFPVAGPWDADLAGTFDPWRLPAFADIPAAGTVIEAGHPVLTFFVTSPSTAECRDRLQLRAAELDRLFAESTP